MTGWRAGIATTCLVLVLWQTVIWTTGVARFILPPPALVAQTIWESRALLAEHAVVTMAEVLIGLLLGAALGFLSAIVLVASPTARALVRPILVFSQAVPVFFIGTYLDPLARLRPLVQDYDDHNHYLFPRYLIIF